MELKSQPTMTEEFTVELIKGRLCVMFVNLIKITLTNSMGQGTAKSIIIPCTIFIKI